MALLLLRPRHGHVQPARGRAPRADHPELVYLEAKFAGLVSYGLSADLLAEVLPLGRPLHAAAVRHHVQAVGQRLEDELGPEQAVFIDGCPAEWRKLPRPDLPLVVGLDGGYVHSAHQISRRDGWFEVIAGKTMTANGAAKSFGFVQTYDTKPKRRLYEALKSQGMQANQQVTFITDGGEDIRNLPLYLNPQAEHLLDWFHVTMRLTVMANMAKSLGPRRQTPTSRGLRRKGFASRMGSKQPHPQSVAPAPDAGDAPAPQHTPPGVDPFQPVRPPTRGPQR